MRIALFIFCQILLSAIYFPAEFKIYPSVSSGEIFAHLQTSPNKLSYGNFSIRLRRNSSRSICPIVVCVCPTISDSTCNDADQCEQEKRSCI